MSQAPTFAVVIPAHDEESVIDRCLRFTAELEPGEAEVVVVANGCSDATAARAAQVPGVRVVELPAAGKADALNAGDRASTTFPRIYLDADIDVSGRALRRMRDALRDHAPRVCAPEIDFRTEGRPWTVRAFYRVYAELPYVRENLIGLGIYGVSEVGRQRFGPFPPVTADDLFVQRQFRLDERLVLLGDVFTVRTPRTLGALVDVRTRTAAGSAELARTAADDQTTGDDRLARTGGSTGRALLLLVLRRPRLLPHAIVYAGVTTVARLRARLRARFRAGVRVGGQGNTQWLRDNSTR